MSLKKLAIAALSFGLAGAPSYAQSTTTDTMQPSTSEECTVPGADNINCQPKAGTDPMNTGSVAKPMATDDNAKVRSQQGCEVPGADNVNCEKPQQ